MNQNAINQLNMFLDDVGFPIDKEGLVHESLDSPLSQGIRDAIALLPEGDYMTREEVRRELIGIPVTDEKDNELEDDSEEIVSEEKIGSISGEPLTALEEERTEE